MGQINVNIQLKNNYSTFFQQFTADTGLDPQNNVAAYIAYFNVRMTDANYQLNRRVTNERNNLLVEPSHNGCEQTSTRVRKYYFNNL